MNKYVSILVFSPRESGNSGYIAKFVSNYHEDEVHVFRVDRETLAPCGNCNYECLSLGKTCPQLDEGFRAMMDLLCDSEMVYFIVPNFCGYPCANYFAFNERTVGYFGMDREKMKRYLQIPKKFIVVSNTEGFETAMKQQTSDEPRILYLKSGKYGKHSTAGDILDSGEAVADLKRFLEEA